jgi:integrase
MSSYVTPHHRGTWKYKRRVPVQLQALLGTKWSREYIPAMSKREADNKGAAFAVRDQGLWDALAKLSPAEAQRFSSNGGLVEAVTRATAIQNVTALVKRLDLSPATPAFIARFQPGRTLGDIAIEQLDGQSRFAALGLAADKTLEVVSKLSPPEYGWDALFANWKRKGKRTKYVSEHTRTLDLLKKILGDVDVRHVTAHDIERFLLALPAYGVASVPMQRKIRFHVSGMFRECIPLWRKDNPCKGVKVEGQHKPTKGRPFTGKHIKAIRKAAGAMRYHDDLHGDAMWVLHLQTFQGCRVNEAAQLQAGDFETVAGVPCVWLREECADTGKKHECKNIKTGDERCVPLHPALWNTKHPRYVGADIRKLAKGKPGDFVFGFERYQRDGKPKPKGGAQWMIQNGHTLLAAAGVTGPGYKPNHSFRHRMNDAMKNAGGLWLSDDERRAFLGHATGVNAGYGGEIMKARAKALWGVDPLSDL